jgi:hypothetical protein
MDEKEWIGRIPKADIAGCIAFSKPRCFLSLVSLLLLASDIPRTGLGMRTLSEYYPNHLAPGSAVFFGPYAYSVLHITCNTSSSHSDTFTCTGRKGTNPLTEVMTWAYGFDTTSIGLRGAVALFNITSFPPFLVDKGNDSRRRNPFATMDLSTTFTTLDGLADGIQALRHPDLSSSVDGPLAHERYASEHVWIDRLHQFLLQPIIANLRWRIHSINMYAKTSREANESLNICTPTTTSAFAMPEWCDEYMKWTVYNFANKAMPGVSISEHIDQRVRTLQEEYPDLWLDAVVFSTRQPMTTASMTYSTFFHNDAWEIVVIIRGRECKARTTGCITKWVDDFRYENVAITTNVAEWYMVTAALRGTAQVYVWLHLTLLLYLCHSVSPPPLSQRLHWIPQIGEWVAAFSTMLKIPFQIVVYGSHVPILLYVLALLIDGKFTDSFLDSYWSTVGGVNYEFHVVNFIKTASVQMRNVWVLALLAKLWTYTKTRRSSWHHHHGILGVQGLAISFTSFLSIFGPYKAKSLRDTSITTVKFIAQSGPGRSTRLNQVRSEPVAWLNSNNFELGDSMYMTLLTIVSVLGLHVLLVGLGRMLSRPAFRRILFRDSMVVPFTAGTIFSTTALAICFRAHVKRTADLRGQVRGWRNPQIAPTVVGDGFVGDGGTLLERSQPDHSHHLSLRETREEQSSEHEWERELAERSETSMSVIQLMNVAMMSDPWTMFRLRILGIELFVYDISPTATKEDSLTGSLETLSAALLPFHPSMMSTKTGLDPRQFEMVCRLDSRDIPLWVLLHCG